MPGKHAAYIVAKGSKQGRPKKINESLAELISDYIEDDIALMSDAAIAEEIRSKTGDKISASTICRWRKQHGIASCGNRSTGRPPTIDEETLTTFMERFTITAFAGGTDTKCKVARISDIRIAETISMETGIKISPDVIFRYRKSHLISSCFSCGGSRPGPGRPRSGSSSPASNKKKTGHKLTISDYELVQVCSSAYEFRPGHWNEKTGKYDRLARYVPKFRQDGLKMYTPLPLCSSSWEASKTQKFKALDGQ